MPKKIQLVLVPMIVVEGRLTPATPAHLRELCGRPETEPLITRDEWFETEEQKRAKRRQERAEKNRAKAEKK